MDSWLRAWMMRPWWKLSEQKEQSPRQPRLLVIRELHFGKRGYAACLRVRGMRVTGIGQRVDGIHLGHGERLRRWVLHDKDIVRVFLGKNVRGEGIEIFVLYRETRCIFARVLLYLLETRQDDCVVGKVVE